MGTYLYMGMYVTSAYIGTYVPSYYHKNEKRILY